jgi:ABC-type Mn2+/Zn2+ transport system ATPase subunit
MTACLERTDKPRITHSATHTWVVADDLDIGYDGVSVVSRIVFNLQPKQALAVVGINGSGKSTLLKTLVGLLRPVGGRVTVFGQLAGALPKRLAYLSQFHASGFVLPLRAVDVVRMGRFTALGLVGRMTRRDHDLVTEALQRMQIADLAEAPLRSLSGGQMQRVYLAQILCRQADLLVLDEPTAGLDLAGKKLFEQALRAELDRGASLITATHDIQEAMMCDQVMLLARRIVALGPPDEVLTPEALMETFGIVLDLKNQELCLAVLDRECGHEWDDNKTQLKE